MVLVNKFSISTIVLLYLVAFGLLWLGYAFFVAPVFGYAGFKWSPNVFKIIESLLIICILLWFLPSNFKKPSDFFVHMHFLLPILPMLVLYGASDYAREYMYFVVLAFAIVCVIRRLRLPIIKGDIVPTSVMMWGSLLFVLSYILGIIMQGGLAYFNLDLQKVYEFRVNAAENLPGIAGYLTPLVSNILLPFILVLGVSQRKWIIACLAILGSVMMFALASHKSALFYPLIVAAIYFIVRSEKRIIPMLLGSYVLFVMISLFPFFLEKIRSLEQTPFSILAGSLGFRRGYFVPAFLNFAYYDFFSTHQYTMWAESKLTLGLVDYPYNLTATHLIGYQFFGNIDMGANTGWLGSGYMHLGFLGMVLYAFIIGLLLSLCDMLAKSKDHCIVVAVLSIPFLALFTSSDLPTVMLTHGFLFALLLVWIFRVKQNKYMVNKPISGQRNIAGIIKI